MARPSRDPIQSGTNGWDATLNDNLIKLFDGPLAIHEHTGDESDLASTFAAASYDNCLVWVDHTVSGWTLYHSDGSTWAAFTTRFTSGNPTQSIIVACSDESTAITATGTKLTFRMPYGFTLTDVRASLGSACSTGTFTVDINEGGTTILSTKLTIDATEKTSTTAAAAAVISDVDLADDAEITIDIDDVGDSTATGLKVTLIGVVA